LWRLIREESVRLIQMTCNPLAQKQLLARIMTP
jgi:hypothetical protein